MARVSNAKARGAVCERQACGPGRRPKLSRHGRLPLVKRQNREAASEQSLFAKPGRERKRVLADISDLGKDLTPVDRAHKRTGGKRLLHLVASRFRLQIRQKR